MRKLPPPGAHRIPELFHQPETVPVVGHHEGVMRLVHYRVDARAAVWTADIVLPEHQPRVSVDLAGRDAFDEGHTASIATATARSHARPWPSGAIGLKLLRRNQQQDTGIGFRVIAADHASSDIAAWGWHDLAQCPIVLANGR